MSKIFLFTIDLITKGEFSESDVQTLKEKILSIEEKEDLSEVFSEVVQLTKDKRVEIYAEDTGITSDSGEEVLSFVKLVEEIVGGFIPGSSFEIGKENPGPSERWVKTEYSWETEDLPEEEEPWDEEAYWDDEWDEWNEEWN